MRRAIGVCAVFGLAVFAQIPPFYAVTPLRVGCGDEAVIKTLLPEHRQNFILPGCISGSEVIPVIRIHQLVTVCDLFKNLQAYRGKLISVRGIYWHGLRQTCPDPFIIRDRTWLPILNLVEAEGRPVPFKTDLQSWDMLDRLVIREAKAKHREEIWVTITGKLNAVHIRADGEIVGGYGHLGVLPAEVIVERIKDVTIEPTPTYDYSEMLRKPIAF